MKGYAIVTTIQRPTGSLMALAEKASLDGMQTLAIGDRKSPTCSWPDSIEFVGISDQSHLAFSLASQLPENHYARKNIGYLLAIAEGAPFIFDTDDDNAPLSSWRARSVVTRARPCLDHGWINAYRWFSDGHIWPRGLPLGNASRNAAPPQDRKSTRLNSSHIQKSRMPSSA